MFKTLPSKKFTWSLIAITSFSLILAVVFAAALGITIARNNSKYLSICVQF